VVDRRDVAALIEREAQAAMLSSALQVGPLTAVIEMTREGGARR